MNQSLVKIMTNNKDYCIDQFVNWERSFFYWKEKYIDEPFTRMTPLRGLMMVNAARNLAHYAHILYPQLRLDKHAR
jgi:hypothetical protein